MQNFMKTIINAVQSWAKKEIKTQIKDSAADWNQNDFNADSYVKNRTHWEEIKEVAFLSETTLNNFEQWEDGIYGSAFNYSQKLTVGQSYTVVWDGVQYNNLVCYNDGDDYLVIGAPYGDFSKYNFGIDYYVPEGILKFYTTNSTKSHTISISIIQSIVHKLDPKYLDLPANLATADDVQSAKQEVLDVANEADAIARFQPNWNQNDETAHSYIKHRTHYITYEALSSSSQSYNFTSNSSYFERFLYIPFTYLTNRCRISLVYGSGYSTPSFILKEISYNNNETIYTYFHEESKHIITVTANHNDETVDIRCITISDSKGLEVYITRPKYTEIVHYLDEKYIPETIARIENVIPVPTTAAVGQLLSVKSVDENSKPTEWEAVDVSNIEGSNGIGIKSIRIEEVV